MKRSKMILRWVYVACIVFFLIRIFPSFWENIKNYDISEWSIAFNKKLLMFVFFGVLSVVNILLCFVHCNNEEWVFVWVRMIIFFIISIKDNITYLYASVLAKCMIFPLTPTQWMFGIIVDDWDEMIADIGIVVGILLSIIALLFFTVIGLLLETLVVGTFSGSVVALSVIFGILGGLLEGIEESQTVYPSGRNIRGRSVGEEIMDVFDEVQGEGREREMLEAIKDIRYYEANRR